MSPCLCVYSFPLCRRAVSLHSFTRTDVCVSLYLLSPPIICSSVQDPGGPASFLHASVELRDNVSRYLRDYKAEMLRYGISEGLQVTSFNRVATDGLQGDGESENRDGEVGRPSHKLQVYGPMVS